VPQAICIRLGSKEGGRVEFIVEGGNTIIRPVLSAENPFEAPAGALEEAFPGGVRDINSFVDEMRRNVRSRKQKRRSIPT